MSFTNYLTDLLLIVRIYVEVPAQYVWKIIKAINKELHLL